MQLSIVIPIGAVHCREIVLAAVLSTCLGCGVGGVEVQGDVTYKGKPVDSGSIVFEPADGMGSSNGGMIADGRYELVGDASPMPGMKTVKIRAVMYTGRRVPAGPPEPPGKMVDEVYTFAAPSQQVEVVAGRVNEIPFHLEPQ